MTDATGSTAPARPIRLVVLAHALGVLTGGSVAVTAIVSLTHDRGADSVGDVAFILLLGVTLAVGWLLAVRLPRHPVGWILLAIPALFTLSAPLTLLQSAIQTSAPGVAKWIVWYNGTDSNPSWSWIPPVWLLLAQLPLRFPNGRLPSPRWRWFSWLTVVALVALCALIGTGETGVPNPMYMPFVHDNVGVLEPACFGLLAVSFIGSIASLFIRYRRATARERAQLRWMVWAVALASGGLILGWILPGSFEGLQGGVLVLYCAVPIAVAIAVLRYRLYEIDRIISRTAAYAIVTLVVVGTYAVVVLLVGLLPALKNSGIETALATLAAAAVFLPVVRWVRRGIDRLFDRAQYNADRVVDAFGERIRNGADPHTAGTDLTVAIQQTLQPSAIGLWTPR